MEVRSARTDEPRVDRADRLAARWEIIQAANKFLIGFHARSLYYPKLLGMKNLQRAVRICRHNHLVKNKVLERAGFNAWRPATIEQPRVPFLIKRMRRMKRG